MPELPEVEVTRMGIAPYAQGQQVTALIIRQPKLRWSIPDQLQQIVGQQIINVRRRAKYLLLDTAIGSAIIHLGMSGNLRVLPANTAAKKHDHVDLVLSNTLIRYHDPRRFGAWLWQPSATIHSVLQKLGPEPLSEDFDAQYLFERSRPKRAPMKQFIMDNHVVVGVGNIYANEALFSAAIHPLRPAHSLTEQESVRLTAAIKMILNQAIAQGGTTLKDFSQTDGKPGYFAQDLLVYGRQGLACVRCGHVLEKRVIGQRTTVFCPDCQH